MVKGVSARTSTRIHLILALFSYLIVCTQSMQMRGVQCISKRCSSLLRGKGNIHFSRIQQAQLQNWKYLQSGVGATRAYSSPSSNEVDSKVGQNDVTKLPRLYVGPLHPTPRYLKSTDSLAAALQSEPLHSTTTSPLMINSIVPLSTDQSHYVRSVLRLGGGGGKKRKAAAGPARLRLFDGVSSAANNGGSDNKKEWLTEVVVDDESDSDNTGNRRRKQQQQQSEPVLVQCLEALPSPSSSSSLSGCWLSIAAPKKRERLKWMLEKTTELGVAGWILLETDRSEIASVGSDRSADKLNNNKDNNDNLAAFAKWQAYAVEAAEQCERTELPQFVTIVDDGNGKDINPSSDVDVTALRTKLSTLFETWSSDGSNTESVKILVCRERINSLPVWRALETVYSATTGEQPASVMFLIGPEGGWSPAEEECMNVMESKYPGCLYNVSLGPTVLRAETAAMTAVAAYTLFHDYRQQND
jgi:RsmE family RNA methyltransferase